jgi:hypothetical protein
LCVGAEGNLVAVIEEVSHFPAWQADRLRVELLLEKASLRAFIRARDGAGGE